MTDPSRIIVGDVIDGLRTLDAGSVQCCVTSPPYWGLRDYGVEGQIGLEKTPDEFVAKMVDVFREVRRVLRDDGTLWLNLGDSYASSGRSQRKESPGVGAKQEMDAPGRSLKWEAGGGHNFSWRIPVKDGEIKPKDLCMIPWRVALALQADGWWLRSVICWAKKSPMPESVTDRPTSSWEPIFLFAKGQHSTRTIQFANLQPELVHFSRNLGEHSANMGTSAACVRLATAIFDATQEKNDFGLPPFYAKEWKKCGNGDHSAFVADLPPDHRLAAYAARLLDGNASTKEFLCEIHSSGVDLANAKHLLIRRRLVECADSPSVLVDGDGTVTIHDTGEVRKINLVHGEIVVTVPTACKYFYDAEAVKEASEQPGRVRNDPVGGVSWEERNQHDKGGVVSGAATRNQRNVWRLGPEPFSGCHFATFPTEIPRRAIKAGTSEKGCCAACGAPWVRVMDVKYVKSPAHGEGSKTGKDDCPHGMTGMPRLSKQTNTTGWEPTCTCGAAVVPCVVLDPFLGSGTTVAVAREMGRHGVGCELNPEYAKLARERIGKAEKPATFRSDRVIDSPLFGGVA